MSKKDDGEKLPYHTVLVKQFPDAIKAVIERSLVGHNKYIEFDSDWMNWKRIENAKERYENAKMRHSFGVGEDDSRLEHLAADAWNSLAILQLEIEENERNNK